MAESLQTCRGLTDNVRCDCEELTPSPSNPSLCEECGHGKSKHPRTARLSCPEPKTVTDIFKYHVGKQSASGSASVSFEDARRDALKGFKTSSDDSTPKSASKTKPDSTFNVSRIVIVRASINKHNVIDDASLPSKVDVAYLEQRGCAITKQVPSLDRNWSYEDTTSFLTNIFPLPMGYVPKSQKLEVVPVTCPDGSDLYTYRGPPKSGWTAHNIYIALRSGIPDDVFDAWGPSPEIDSSSMITDLDSSSDDGGSSDYVANVVTKGEENTSNGSAIATRATLKRKLDAVNPPDADPEDSRQVKKQRKSVLSTYRKITPAPRLVVDGFSGSFDATYVPGPWDDSYHLSLPSQFT